MSSVVVNLEITLKTVHPCVYNVYIYIYIWSHSITYERDFLSEWQAIERAGDLAADLGFSAELRIDSIVLPCATNSVSTRSHFIPWCTYFLDWMMTPTFLRFKFTMILWLDGKINLGTLDLCMKRMISSL